MEEQSYLINGKVFATHDPALQEALGRVYATPVRPRCLCVHGGVEMYVSKFKDFTIKRMTGTGGEHHPTCPSYELTAADSGLGQVLGEAIIDRGQDIVELRLDFHLTRYLGRNGVFRVPASPSQVVATRTQLSLRGLLHYLWERAGTTKYSRNGQGIYLSNHGVCSESAVHF